LHFITTNAELVATSIDYRETLFHKTIEILDRCDTQVFRNWITSAFEVGDRKE